MQEILWKNLVYYDETSPSKLRRLVNVYAGNKKQILKCKAGDVVGCKSIKYWLTKYKSKTVMVHKIIYEIFYNEKLKEDEYIDHINGDSFDNSIDNLRKVTRQQNYQNCKKRKDNSSGQTGVSYVEHGSRHGFVAYWQEDFKRRSKTFNFKDYGDKAFELACAYRNDKIKMLNSSGQDYTERHGK